MSDLVGMDINDLLNGAIDITKFDEKNIINDIIKFDHDLLIEMSGFIKVYKSDNGFDVTISLLK